MENTAHKQDTNSYCWNYLAKNPHAIKQKIAIVYAGRSGSMMLSGLLEGHSYLLSFNYYCDAALYSTLKKHQAHGNVTVASFKRLLRENIDSIFDIFYKHPLLPNELRQNGFDIDAFMAELKIICDNVTDSQMNLDLMLNIVFIAYGKTLKRPLNTIHPIIILQIHSPFFIDDWRYLFRNLNNLNLITMVRNPLKAIDSHFYHHTYELISPPWHDFYERIIIEYTKSFLPFFDSELSQQSYCMLFEDLHMHTEKTMTALCRHLDIPFEAVLLEESIQGQKALLPSAGVTVSGTSRERAMNESLKMMGRSDINFIEYLFGDLIKDLGYSLKSSSKQRFLSVFRLTDLELLFVNNELQEKGGSPTQNINILRKFINKYRRFRLKAELIVKAFKLHRKICKLRIQKEEMPYTLKVIRN